MCHVKLGHIASADAIKLTRKMASVTMLTIDFFLAMYLEFQGVWEKVL